MKNNKTDNLLSFIDTPRKVTNKRASAQRNKDFDEIYISAAPEELAQQASRCLDCGNPYCEWKCPLHNYIPDWLKLTQNLKLNDAAELMHQTNPLPEICGRVCPQDRLCEQACTLNTGFGAITIGAIEKNISDHAIAQGWKPGLSKVQYNGKSVAIVGAGPAGIGCAELLTRSGIKAVVYDKYPEIGGLLTFGIPGFKLDKEIVRKRREILETMGIEFRLNVEIGKDLDIAQLHQQYDAVFLATGSYQSMDGGLPGRDVEGVLYALDYLIGNVNEQQQFQLDDYKYHDLKNKRVIVLGGGDTAMDCVRSAVRQQAKSVVCMYRRDKDSMPGSRQEVINASEEGVKFIFQKQPLSIEQVDGKVSAIKVVDMKPETDSGQGIGKFKADMNSEQLVEADVIIIAFGFQPSPPNWLKDFNIQLQADGRVITGVVAGNAQDFLEHPDNRQSHQQQVASVNQANLEQNSYPQQTSSSGFFAGGDMVRGADLVVNAIADGRQAARDIINSLKSCKSE